MNKYATERKGMMPGFMHGCMILLMLFVIGTISVADIIDVRFSPHGGCRARIIELINTTTGDIVCAIYSFTSKDLAMALISQHEKGRSVRVLTDRQQMKHRSSVMSWMKREIPCRYLPIKATRGMMHHKFMVIHNKYCVTGSYNWSQNAENYNNENLIIIDDEDLAKTYVDEFNRLWSQAGEIPYDSRQ